MQISKIIDIIKNNKIAVIIITALLFILLAIGLVSCSSKDEPADSDTEMPGLPDEEIVVDDDYEESEDDKVYDMTLDALDTEKLESTILEKVGNVQKFMH